MGKKIYTILHSKYFCLSEHMNNASKNTVSKATSRLFVSEMIAKVEKT